MSTNSKKIDPKINPDAYLQALAAKPGVVVSVYEDAQAEADIQTLQDVRQYLGDIITTGESALDPKRLYQQVSQLLGL